MGPQLRESLEQICIDHWKACLRACNTSAAVMLVLSTALAGAHDPGTQQTLQLGMLMELLERRYSIQLQRQCPCKPWVDYILRLWLCLYSLYIEESDGVAEDLVLNTLPAMLPDNTAAAGRLLREALSRVNATWKGYSSRVGDLLPFR